MLCCTLQELCHCAHVALLENKPTAKEQAGRVKEWGEVCLRPSPFLSHSLLKRLVARNTKNTSQQIIDPNKMGNRNKSDSPALDRPRVCRGQKRRDGDEDSVGRWADRAEKRRRGKDGTPLPAGGKVNGSFLLFYGYTVLVALAPYILDCAVLYFTETVSLCARSSFRE